MSRPGRDSHHNLGMLLPGTPAPPFTLSDQDGHPTSLAEFAGHWVLLWWYPKAATPG